MSDCEKCLRKLKCFVYLSDLRTIQCSDYITNEDELSTEWSEETMSETTILDSGNRREFETGAVRDIQEGKGRCDLMPLDVIVTYFSYIEQTDDIRRILAGIDMFKKSGNYNYLFPSIKSFCDIEFNDCSTMFLEVSKHFEEGAKKYGENNWQKGIPTHCYIDSAVRHYLKYLRGDKDEPHDRAFVWNILCCIWTCIHKPELNDYANRGD